MRHTNTLRLDSYADELDQDLALETRSDPAPLSPIAPIEQIIKEARAGRPFILVDAEDRENEGDIIIPAQMASHEHINFMAKHARGLICLAITSERAAQLRLPPMAPDNRSGHGTAFTVSIEAKLGVSTGISAHDRAHTIAVAVDPEKKAGDIVSPGHVFPLVARDGGVLVRAGHTEAAVDIARLAGLNPSGVICEVMNDDGTMARLPDLIEFARLHGLRIGTIADLIAYRRRTERHVHRIMERPFESIHGGGWRMRVYRNELDGIEHVALIKGQIDDKRPTLVRMHHINIIADIMGCANERHDYVAAAMNAIARNEGGGMIVFIRDLDGATFSKRYGGSDQASATGTLRDYGVGAQILLDAGVKDMVLLTSRNSKVAGLDGYGLNIVRRRPLSL